MIAAAALLVRWLGGPWQATAPRYTPSVRMPIEILKERFARLRVLAAAPPAQRPVLLYNPKSGGGKADPAFVAAAEALGAGYLQWYALRARSRYQVRRSDRRSGSSSGDAAPAVRKMTRTSSLPQRSIASHIERILRATDGDIAAIICTHSHADHSPAARPLQARVVEASNTVPMAMPADQPQSS